MGEILKKEQLGVGFGVDIGELKNVLILGRWDYIGEAVNNASKLQAKANNAVVISDECYQKIEEQSLKTDFKNPDAYYVYQIK